MDFGKIWNNIIKYQEEFFSTVTGKEFTYKIYDNNYLCVTRINGDKINEINRRISKENIKKAFTIINPDYTKLNNAGIQGPSYVLAIMTDERITQK